MSKTMKHILAMVVALMMVFSIVVPTFAYAEETGESNSSAVTMESTAETTNGTTLSAENVVENSPYKSYCAIGDSFSTGYGPLMNNWNFSNYIFVAPKAGSYTYNLVNDLGLNMDTDFHSLNAVDLLLIDAYYAIGGNPDAVVDPTNTDSTVSYTEDAKAYHDEEDGEVFMQLLDELHAGEGAERIQNSDLVTIQIGLADLAIYPVNRAEQVADESTTKTTDETTEALIAAGIQNYIKYLPKLLQRIRDLNPNAKIVLLSTFDPYEKVVAEGDSDAQTLEAVRAGLNILNYYIRLNAAFYSSTYVDITGVGAYVDNDTITVPAGELEEFSHENHFGAAGHQYVEKQILDALGLELGSLTPSTDDSTSYLAFTSDTHCADDGNTVSRLDTWLDEVSDDLGDITFDSIGVCGDLASASLSGTAYSNKIQMLMNTVDNNVNVVKGIYTTGNHEWSPGEMASQSEYAPYTNITRLGEAADTDRYQIYCFGAAQYDQQFNDDDIQALSDYLANEADNTKPVFVMSHFPLHHYQDRTSTNADKVIALLNNYPNVIFLWGHNHTLSDTNYGIVNDDSIDGTPINFIYCAAGCMSDSDYSSGSGNTEEKGLVAAVDGDDDLTLTYYDKDSEVVSSFDVNIVNGTSEEIETVPADMAANFDGQIYSSSSTLAEGEYVFTVGKTAMNSQAHEGYTCVNNNINYSYPGLRGAKVAISSSGKLTAGLTEDEVWTVAKVSNGYTIQNKSTGKYLTGYYYTDAGAEIKLEDEPGTNGVWSYDGNYLKNVATGKYLNFEVEGDVSGTQTGGTLDVFTLRSASNDVISLYTVAGASEPVTVTNYSVANTFTDGSWYLISAENNAVIPTANDGYVTVNGSTYKYSGLNGKSITVSGNYVTSKVTTDMLWQAEAVDGGFTLKNKDGKYLNASYSTTESGYAGVGNLYVSDTPQTWVLSGTSLKNSSCGKYLNYQSDSDIDGTKQSGNAQFFTVRSSSKDEVTVYLSANGCNENVDENEVIDTDNDVAKTEVVPFFEQVTSSTLEDGAQIIFTSKDKVMTDEANSGYKNKDTSGSYYSYSGLSAADLGATAGSDISNLDVDATVWTVEKVDDATYRFKNSEGKYLSGSYGAGTFDVSGTSYSGKIGTVTLVDTADDSCIWTYSNASGVVTLTNKNCGKVLTYNDGAKVDGTILEPSSKDEVSEFTVRSSAKYSLYLYQKVEKTYTLTSDVLNDGATVVFAYSNYFMGSSRGIGYKNKYDGSYYQYTGLNAGNLGATAGTSLTKLPSVTTDMLWTVEKVDGGYRFKNANGRYLSATYTTGSIDVTEDGEDLTVDAAGIGKLTIVATPNDNCVWTVSFSSGVADIVNVATGKHLTYNKPDDVTGTCLDPADKSTVSLFTVRSSRTHSMYIYQEKTKIATEITSGESYIMVNSEGYAVSSNKGTGYNDVNSNYRYDGLTPVAVTVEDGKIASTLTTDLVWKLTKSGNGYTIQNAEGQYLNSVYKDVAGGAEDEGVNVFFSETPEVWDIQNGYLVSETTGKYLTRQTNSGSANVFTLRSSKTSAQTFSFYGMSQADTVTALYASTVGGTVSQTREVLDKTAFEVGTATFTGSTATAQDGYTFTGWYSGDTLLTTEATYVPTAAGIYEARFTENKATITYQPMLKGEEGSVEDLALSTSEETYGVVTGTIQGSTANKTNGYTFLYWTSDPEGTKVVSKNNTYTPTNTGADAAYYAWYEKELVCFADALTTLSGIEQGNHALLVNGTNYGKYVFTQSGTGWTIYSVDQKAFVSVDSNYALTYSNVAKIWNYGTSGFYVTKSTTFLWFTFTTNYYLAGSNGQLTTSTSAPSTTKFADVTKVGYTSHILEASTDGHTQLCSRCGEKVMIAGTEHTYVYTNNGDGTHTGVCACGATTGKVAHTETTESLNATQHQTTCSVCGAVTTANHELTYAHDDETDSDHHTATCSVCGYTETVNHTYVYTDNEDGTQTGTCVCGKTVTVENAAYIESVTAKQTSTTTSGYWGFVNWWIRYIPGTTTYQVTITATPKNTTVNKVEYSTDGVTYKTGTTLTSSTSVKTLNVRVTDGNGVVTDWVVTPTA